MAGGGGAAGTGRGRLGHPVRFGEDSRWPLHTGAFWVRPNSRSTNYRESAVLNPQRRGIGGGVGRDRAPRWGSLLPRDTAPPPPPTPPRTSQVWAYPFVPCAHGLLPALSTCPFSRDSASGPTCVPSPGSPCPRLPPSRLQGTWASKPGREASEGPPGGARGRGPAPRSQSPPRPRCGHPGTAPRTPSQARATAAAGSGKPGRARPVRIRVWCPGLGGSQGAPAGCPTPARYSPQLGCRDPAGAGEPSPRPAATARELCRRLAPARSSCSSFPGNFRPGIPPPARRAAPPARARGPGASAG
jgi:hypothetical protein